jgi:hypothetical protein
MVRMTVYFNFKLLIIINLLIDITSVKIKYEEGFANVLGHVFTKPEVMWTIADKSLVIPTGNDFDLTYLNIY